ncbi:MAG: hypothetical protein WB421_22155 [Terriglobales bacterium]|jgi:hypothetical protein
MHPQLENALWIAHPALQLCVLAAIFWRRMHKTFPVFLTYIATQVLIFAILFPIRKWGTYAEYFYTYWICAGVTLVIGFMVIHEIFLDIFRPFHALKDLGSVLFKWAGLVMLLLACVVAAASPASSDGPLVQAVITVQRCVRMIQCGLVLFLMIFSNYVGVSWKQRSFGVALGFGGFAIVEQLTVAMQASGYIREDKLNLIVMFAYNAAIATWFGYMAVKQTQRDDMTVLLTSKRWDQSLGDLQQPGAPDSLIPMFEGMVDRAFSKTNGQSFMGNHSAIGESSLSTRVPDTTAVMIAGKLY